MEGHQAAGDEEKGSLAFIPSSGNGGSSLTCQSVIENKGVAMASNDPSTALSSPAEASPAKSGISSPTTFEGVIGSGPAISGMASASDSLTIDRTSLELFQSCAWPPGTVFGDPNNEKNFPSVLKFKGVSVTLENHSVWKQFYNCGTEMILTKQGRRMFPYCRYRLTGLEPNRRYILVLSIVPSDQFKYRWNSTTWEITGQAENQCQGLVRAFSHHNSPSLGSEWMSGLVSFYRLKITNNLNGWQDGHMVLHSMHRYVPRLNVIPVPDGQLATPDQPFVKGPESMTFTFPQTEFMAVTTYQNFRITQLKITYNPFAKGFRDDGSNCRSTKLDTDTQPGVKKDPDQKPAEGVDIKEEAVDLSMKKPRISAPPPPPPPPPAHTQQVTRLVLKPFMSKTSTDDPQAIKIIRRSSGKHAPAELVVVQRAPAFEPKEEKHPVSVTPTLQQYITKAAPVTPASSRSTLASPQGNAKRRKRINRRSAKNAGKAAATSPVALRSPSLGVSMQPEVDELEGLVFVSFISKEALEIHAGDKPVSGTASALPAAKDPQTQCEPAAEESPPTPPSVQEIISRLEAVLLQDLKVLKHRQVIHPVLQEVGLKLSSLDQSASIDLLYLGVRLPLPPTVPAEQRPQGPSPPPRCDQGLPFISRTGKTRDVTKIKGWKSKFISGEEASKCDGPQKDLSAFCSNMLDEYLESEAQQISERAAAFSTSPEAVAYQLPAKSSSYVKTLDSVLKRNAAAKTQTRANRPCPLSHKPLLYSALVSPAPPLSRPATPPRVKAEAEPVQVSAAAQTPEGPALPARSPAPGPNAAFTPTSPVSPRTKPQVLSKVQLKLLEMEKEAVNQGLSHTHLTADRLSVALSVLLTAKMQFNQYLNAPLQPWLRSEGPPCGRGSCRLGCVCSGIQRPVRGLHCRQTDCMLGCTCLKRNITKYLTMEENQDQNQNQDQPYPSITNVEHILKPLMGVAKLWHRSTGDLDLDTEPLFTPRSAVFPVASKVQNHGQRPRPKQPLREEDKDPVYKYFESMMTCARVRKFSSKPSPEVTMEPRDPFTATPSAPKEPKTTMAKNYHRTILSVRHSEKSPAVAQSSQKEARMQIEIQSACQWQKDHKVVLEALCLRMNQNRLSQRFFIGPYHIRPISKINMRKPSGAVVTYRVNISKPMRDSDDDDDKDEDKSDVSDEENVSDVSVSGEAREEEKEWRPAEEPEIKCGVTPFLSGVLAAGSLKATKKTRGCVTSGLVQVNGKFYSQAKLLLGNMGSLHPANRLAAYLTGRLRVPHKFKSSESGTAKNTAKRTSDILPAAPQPEPQTSTPLVSKQSGLLRSFPSLSPSSRVSLTVSQSLKTPGFLAERGTYSFRICPPGGQSAKAPNPTGVTLPGGFTLIDLPKPGAPAPALTGNAAKMSTDAARPQEDALFRSVHSPAEPGLENGHAEVTDRVSAGGGSSVELTCDESDDARRRLGESNASETSDSSDYGEEEEDEPVDIETVEEMKQDLTIARMREALGQSLISSVDSDLADRHMDGEESRVSRRPLNHTVGERFRRFQQRFLFNKLKVLLNCDARASKVTLLTLALSEIQNQLKASESLLQKKKKLIEMQSAYLRRVSILSGKSSELIKKKLIEICNKQKIREHIGTEVSPSCPRSPQREPAHLQADAQPPQTQPEDLSTRRVAARPTAVQNLSPAASLPVPDKPAPAPKEETDAAPDPARPRNRPTAQSYAYPLIRSKTGRIILPSSLKSPMQGLYKLMVMKGEQSEHSSAPSRPDSGSSPDTTSPLSMIAQLNSSTPASSGAGQNGSPEGGTTLGSDQSVAGHPGPATAARAQNVARRGRGRPPKQTQTVTPGGGNEKRSPVEKAGIETNGEQTAVKEPTEAEGTLGNIGKVVFNPPPAKRGRGRPPKSKKKPEDTEWRETSAGTEPKHKSPATQTGSGHPAVSPVRWPRSLKSPESISKDSPSSRPLTRGALGKDFPSAKKRSWIDVQKDLEREME
ncbi:MAX gene-associated protein [Genypterus blacodes]|uniref:MAX gene-associated protein n=1 Tax=Genypterus blacodes TaxID=154954 RepID=UPI003F766D4B